MGLVVSVLDYPQIWCIVTRLFMSPVTCQSRVHYRSVRLAGYRVLAFWVIGAILIVLGVIGLAGALVIRPIKVSKISENITGRDSAGQVMSTESSPVMRPDYYRGYYQGAPYGLLGMLRMARTGSGRDMESRALTGQDSGRDVD